MILPDLRPTIKGRGGRDIRRRNDVAELTRVALAARVAHHVDAPFGRRVRLLERPPPSSSCTPASRRRGRSLAENVKFTRSRRGVRRGACRTHANGRDVRFTAIFKRTAAVVDQVDDDDRTAKCPARTEQCGVCFYAAGPQTGVVLDVSPRTAMCVRNVDVQMCPAVHTMTRS